MAFLNIYTREPGRALFFLLLLAVLLIERILLQRKTLKTNLARFREVCGSDQITYTTRLAETDTAYLLFTRARQFLPVFKSDLADPQAFLDDLKSRPTNIRW